MTKKIRTYSTEFKAEAVKKIADNDGNISATANSLVSPCRPYLTGITKPLKASLKGLSSTIHSLWP